MNRQKHQLIGEDATKLQFNTDYNFLHHFEVNHAIMNEQNSIQTILDTLQATTSDKHIRKIIVFGLQSQFETSNNFQTISKIHQSLQAKSHTTISINSNRNCNANVNQPKTASKNVFAIQSIMCSIFSFLDFISILKCSRVNKQWLYDSYHPTSMTHVETNQLYRYHAHNDYYGRDEVERQYIQNYEHFSNILRYKHVCSLDIGEWDCLLNDYFGNLQKFLNISKLCVNFTQTYFGYFNSDGANMIDMTKKVVENNRNNLKYLSFKMEKKNSSDDYTIRYDYAKRLLDSDFLQSVFLCNLAELRISGMVVKGLYLNKCEISDDASNINKNKLETLIIKDSSLELEFWHDLADDKSNLSNIKKIIFHSCGIGKYDEKNQEMISSEYIPKITAKLSNLTHFECIDVECNLFDTNVINMTFSFVYHLSLNPAARDSLKSLNIVITEHWFDFKSPLQPSRPVQCLLGTQSEPQECIVMDNDGMALNFSKLEHVKLDIYSTSPLDAIKGADQMKRVLGIFCTQSNAEIDTIDATRLPVDFTSSPNNKSTCRSNSKRWISNVKLLEMKRIDLFDQSSAYMMLTTLDEIEFTSLNKFDLTASSDRHNSEYNKGGIYCCLQRESFKSMEDLIQVMQLVSAKSDNGIDIKLRDCINRLYLSVNISAQKDKTHWNEHFDKISTVLAEWIEDENKDIFLQFKLNDITVEDKDFGFSEKFAGCLASKINIIDNIDMNDPAVDKLTKSEFVGPNYGGTSRHVANCVVFNDRLSIGVHMKDLYFSMFESEIEIDLIVRIKSIKSSKANDFYHSDLLGCTCQRDREYDAQVDCY